MFSASRRHSRYTIYSDDEDMGADAYDCPLRYRVPGGASPVRRVSWNANGTAAHCYVEDRTITGRTRIKREPGFRDEPSGDRDYLDNSGSSVDGLYMCPRAPALKRLRRQGASSSAAVSSVLRGLPAPAGRRGILAAASSPNTPPAAGTVPPVHCVSSTVRLGEARSAARLSMFQKLSNSALPTYDAGYAGAGGSRSNVVIKNTSALGTYGRDMTAAAGHTDPVIGRDDEIDRVVCILCRRIKNNAMLVGDPGVGKTAIVEGLAQRIAAGAVPAALSGARVVELDLGALVAGTRYRGMFEERIKKVIQQAEKADGKVVLFIDEVHMLLGAGQSSKSAMDCANLLKPALARGRIRCVGATTFEEHRKYVEKDAAFERRFQKVHVQEPSMEATIAILQGLKRQYEEHHGTTIQDVAIVAAARFANRYITGRQFPDKAIDLMDEACAMTRMQTDNQMKGNAKHHTPATAVNEAIVCPYQVAQVVSRWTGIPVNTLDQNEKEKLMHLADRLQERVVGQQEAVNLVAQAVLRSRTGMDQPEQPIGSFLFLGSTGVGKTELAKALAEQLFDSEKMLIRFDMTEFVGTQSVMRLIGAPPSYHGHEDGGQLTEKVRQRPYSVILFDEIEKADPAVFNVFLQLLDDGILTDGKGRTVNFKNTIIVMTSNLGAEYLMEAINGEKSMEAARDLVIKQAQNHFKPEFLNRLSELVVFEPLPQDKLREVAYIQMKGVIARVADKGIALSASDAAMDVVLSESHNPLYGARPIRRWLQKNVMTKLSEMFVKGELDAGCNIVIDASENKKDLTYRVVNNNAAVHLARRLDKMPDIPSDSESEGDINLTAPIAKKLKGVTILSAPK